MLTIIWPALIALIGLFLIVAFVAPPERWATIGRILFLAGMIAVCLLLAKAKFGVP